MVIVHRLSFSRLVCKKILNKNFFFLINLNGFQTEKIYRTFHVSAYKFIDKWNTTLNKLSSNAAHDTRANHGQLSELS